MGCLIVAIAGPLDSPEKDLSGPNGDLCSGVPVSAGDRGGGFERASDSPPPPGPALVRTYGLHGNADVSLITPARVE